MNDADAQRLLAGIDAPRPLPPSLRDDLVGTLTDATTLAATDAPRPLPDDLRHRLEASLISATARPMPRSLRRRVLGTAAWPSLPVIGAVAATLMLIVGGLVIATRPSTEQRDQTASGPSANADSGTANATGGLSAGSSSEQFDASAGSGGAATGGAAAPAVNQSRTADKAAAGPIQITVLAPNSGDVRTGFDAYLATVNATGGINGRQLEPIEGPGGVANVNLGSEVTTGSGGADVIFDSVWYPASYLSGPKLSLSSPFQRQARLAVDRAYPDKDNSGRVALYTSMTAPWNTLISSAFQDELEVRGLTVVKVAFTPRAPAYVPGVDAAFLALSPADALAWINGAAVAPSHGVWAMGSAYDEHLAQKAASLHLRVLSPYRPIDGDEATVLRNALPDHDLTVTAVHGWVTAKAMVELLRRNGGAKLTTTDVDALAGWDPLWAPRYETRPGGRDRTPEAIVLVPKDGRFVAEGSFLRDR